MLYYIAVIQSWSRRVLNSVCKSVCKRIRPKWKALYDRIYLIRDHHCRQHRLKRAKTATFAVCLCVCLWVSSSSAVLYVEQSLLCVEFAGFGCQLIRAAIEIAAIIIRGIIRRFLKWWSRLVFPPFFFAAPLSFTIFYSALLRSTWSAFLYTLPKHTLSVTVTAGSASSFGLLSSRSRAMKLKRRIIGTAGISLDYFFWPFFFVFILQIYLYSPSPFPVVVVFFLFELVLFAWWWGGLNSERRTLLRIQRQSQWTAEQPKRSPSDDYYSGRFNVLFASLVVVDLNFLLLYFIDDNDCQNRSC